MLDVPRTAETRRAIELRGSAASAFGSSSTRWLWLAVFVAAFSLLAAAALRPGHADTASSGVPASLSSALQHDGITLAPATLGAPTTLVRTPTGAGLTLGGGARIRIGAGGAVHAHAKGESLALRPVGIGRTRLAATSRGALQVRAGRSSEHIGSSTVAWYRATPAGLEQGFSVGERPAGAGALRIAMQTSGTLVPRLTSPTSVSLRSADAGSTGLTYSGLVVTDARGASIPAHLAVVGRTVQIVVSDAHAVYPLVVDPTIAEQVQLSDPGGVAPYRFGTSVAISADGNTALVGSPNRRYGGVTSGAVFFYVRTGSVWSQQAILASGAGATGTDVFGVSVSLSADGNTALVGARGTDSNAGAAYVFTRSGTDWTLESRLPVTGLTAGDWFGFTVSLSSDGNTALVGAEEAASSAGRAYVFTRTAGIWSQQQQLTAGDTAASDRFSGALSLSGDGNTALIGAFGKTGGGAAYAFTRSSGSWSQQAEMTASDQAANDAFGTQLALSRDGATAVISSTGNATNTGAAYVFLHSGSTWTQQTKLTASDAATSSFFGNGVAIAADGNTVLVSKNAGTGAAYSFTRASAVWTQQQRLTGSSGGSGDQYGFAMAMSSDTNTVLIGAKFQNGQLGGAYVYAVSTAIAVTSSLPSPAVAAPVTFTATITPSPTTGTVSFSDGVTVITGCSAVVPTSGVATCTTAYASSGSHSITASFSGDAYLGSTSPALVQTVTAAATSALASSTASPTTVGSTTTYRLTITPPPSGGTVSFSDGGPPLPGCSTASVNASTGVATCSIVYATAGSRTMTATYSGTADYSGSFGTMSQSVIRTATASTMSSPVNPSTVGSPTTYSVTIAPVPGSGTVSFLDQGTTIGTCSSAAVDPTTGVASCTIVYPSAGTHTVSASFPGNAAYSPSSAPSLSQVVGRAGTSTTLTSSANPGISGTDTTYTVTVAPAPGAGTVAFSDGGSAIAGCGSLPLGTTTGSATCKVAYVGAGSHAVTATYSGTADYLGSTASALAQVISAAPVTPPTPTTPTAPTAPTAQTTLASPTVVTHPNASTTETSARFTFTGAADSTLRCTLDGTALAACTSPAMFSGLPMGAHTFGVLQTDSAGRTSPITTVNWRIRPLAVTRAIGPSVAADALSVPHGDKVSVQCALRTGSITACTVTVRSTVRGKSTIIGRGNATSPGRQHVPVTIRLTGAGRTLAGRPGGVKVRMQAIIHAGGARILPASTTSRLVLPTLLVTPGDLLFDSGSAILKPAATRSIEHLRMTIPGAKGLACVGFTDDLGTAEHNLTLGAARARAVCAVLAAGTKAHTSSTSLGAAQPRGRNDSASGRALNRRVEVHISY